MKISEPVLVAMAVVPTASAWSHRGHRRFITNTATIPLPSDILLAMRKRRRQKFLDEGLTPSDFADVRKRRQENFQDSDLTSTDIMEMRQRRHQQFLNQDSTPTDILSHRRRHQQFLDEDSSNPSDIMAMRKRRHLMFKGKGSAPADLMAIRKQLHHQKFMDNDSTPDRMAMRNRLQQKFMGNNNALTRVSPGYDIQDTDEQIQIYIDVPGVKPEDVNVTVEEDGKVLAITAQREKVGDNESSHTSSVSQSFTLDPVVDIDKISASLKNGLLIVTAPKDPSRAKKHIRNIPVEMASEDETLAAEETAADGKEADASAKEKEGDWIDLKNE